MKRNFILMHLKLMSMICQYINRLAYEQFMVVIDCLEKIPVLNQIIMKI